MTDSGSRIAGLRASVHQPEDLVLGKAPDCAPCGVFHEQSLAPESSMDLHAAARPTLSTRYQTRPVPGPEDEEPVSAPVPGLAVVSGEHTASGSSWPTAAGPLGLRLKMLTTIRMTTGD